VVSADRLIEELWGADSPATATNSLQALVSKLRRALPEGAVVTRSPGYLLNVNPEAIDVGRFWALAAEGRKALTEGQPDQAALRLRQALSLWRGEALADVAYEEFASGEIARLSEERQAVLEDRLEADLALGHHAEIVGELEEAVAAEPLRERSRAQLMLALYRSGRQADALRQYQEARRVLGDELGLDPGPELRRLEAAMLAQQPSLDLPRELIPALSKRRRRANLRAPLTPIIGREKELAELNALICAHRLVTVVGPGGAGKTRLAVETALRLQDRFEDRVWMVELAALSDPTVVGSAMATALGVPDLPGHAAPDGTLDRLAEYLADDALVVLDNCEHLVGEAARAAEALLSSCPALTILATSREALGVPSERLWPTPPLEPSAAIALFADRAAAVSPAFTLSADTEGVVAQICARVDGLPLAVELAAARVKAFPVAQIAARLDDRFRFLNVGARTASARQQSLRAVVDWSYDLLFDDERRLFNRLSVFGGGCHLDAVIEVCADDHTPASDISDLLARLVDKSVLVADHRGPEARFSMLQTLQEYGAERLADAGEADLFRTRHRQCFTELANRSYSAFKGEDQRGWFRSVEQEIENLRAALGSAVHAEDAESALVIAGGLGCYWQDRGRASEGLLWLNTALASEGEVRPTTKCNALLWRKILSGQAGLPDPGPVTAEIIDFARAAHDAEWVAWAQVLLAEPALARGDVQSAMDLYEPARAFFAHQADPFAASLVAFMDANTALFSGDLSSAERHWGACAALARETGSIALEGLCQVQMCNLAESRADYARAEECLEAAIRLEVDTNTRAHDVTLLARLANLAMLRGDHSRADALFSEATQVASDAALRPVLARALSGIAARHRHAGRIDAAEDAARRALALHRESGFGPGVIGSLCLLGFISETRNEIAEAERLHREALRWARQVGDPRAIALGLEGLAGVALRNNDPKRGAMLLGAASGLRDAPGLRPDALGASLGTMRVLTSGTLDDRFDAELIDAAVRARMEATEFESAFGAGAEVALDDLLVM
jgi:predicted ATPase/DNA-binding SARP family transcriptional activator